MNSNVERSEEFSKKLEVFKQGKQLGLAITQNQLYFWSASPILIVY